MHEIERIFHKETIRETSGRLAVPNAATFPEGPLDKTESMARASFKSCWVEFSDGGG